MTMRQISIFCSLFFSLYINNVIAEDVKSNDIHFLRQDQSMINITAQSEYLLIPVEEAQENSHIRVIQNNNCIKEFNVKLAVNNIDYYVPLMLNSLGGKDAVLDIHLNNNNAKGVDTKDFICWKELKYSSTFDTTNIEMYRPTYHHTPLWGWMNDPNGMFYKDGVWHLYYQHNPYGSQWENMTWGHSTSTDLVNWTFEGEAIEPDALGTIFSCSCVVDKNNTAGFGKNAVVAMYTSAGKSQTQSLAYSVDGGKTFTKYATNPVITSDVPDFRDPHMFWHEQTGKWILILAAGQHMEIFSSDNLKQWTYESSFGEGYGNHGGVWECPDLFQIGNKWFLLCNINPGGPFGGSATQYFVGRFDGKEFVCEDSPLETKWMDYGKDHYATVSFDNAPEGRRVVIPWMSNWQYANQVPTKQFRSANGLPRDISSFDYKGETYLKILPSKELDAIRGTKTNVLHATAEIVVTIKGNTTITLSNDKGEQVVMTYNDKDETFSMDRTQSGDVSFSNDFPVVTTAPTHGKISALRIFIDNSSIEVFDTGGKMVMTNLVFPTSPYNKLSTTGKAKAVIYDIK